MREFEPTGDVVVDVCRLQARAVMRLRKLKPKTEREQEVLDDAVELLKYAGELLREWETDRMDLEADDTAISALVEHHVARILAPADSPLDDPAAMARATEALQTSRAMALDQRAHYIVAVALQDREVQR